MDGRNEYEMAVALLQFKKSYIDLCKASRKLPDLDVSDCYPFYLLDFEDIETAVIQWCNLHSNKLMEQVPDRVDNPACLSCVHMRIGLGADGLCKGGPCTVYPYILFSKEACLPALLEHYPLAVINNDTLSALHVKYIELCNRIFTTKG